MSEGEMTDMRKCRQCGWEGSWRECATRIFGRGASLSRAIEECPRCGADVAITSVGLSSRSPDRRKGRTG